jgi:DNA-binding GntR family transcriptional regulator
MRLSVSEGMAYKTKQEFVYQTLRRAILRCELHPGQRLPTKEIANLLGVSLIPVREALQLLQSEGLVENRPHVGAAVARISGSSVAEVFTLLEGLETVAVRVAARRMPPGEIDALAGLLAEMDAAVEVGEYELWGELNTRLHVSIAGYAGMPTLREMTERVFDLWHRVQRCFLKEVLVQRVLQAQQEHHAILRALRERDEAELERLVKVHNRNAMEAYTNHLSNGSTGSGEVREDRLREQVAPGGDRDITARPA